MDGEPVHRAAVRRGQDPLDLPPPAQRRETSFAPLTTTTPRSGISAAFSTSQSTAGAVGRPGCALTATGRPRATAATRAASSATVARAIESPTTRTPSPSTTARNRPGSLIRGV
ncbi:hypothetical protein E1212_19210 [Jiangella ureilytica]|uniref:Uncharacterized protein n=1 Tax=Jiangella ureilytica TaxID=2530374 RepID=A0A4R4RID5_9ACTN|nr:hypothetical protein [Jiangella ureilytica]TDC49104.1 hypothetical protein E1212_19210 [Jiangella ureilytica]